MPETLPTVAMVLETGEQPPTVEVDVNTVEVKVPFEPGTSRKSDREDSVLADVVEEVSTAKLDQGLN